MKGIFFLLIIISLQLFTSCKERDKARDTTIIQAQYLKGSDTVIYTAENKPLYASYAKGRYQVVFDYDNLENLKLISGSFLGNKYGHQFFFDEKGDISTYYFAAGDNMHSTYELLNKKGRFLETGTSFVDYMLVQTEEDSPKKKIRVLFSLFPRGNLKVLYSLNGKDYHQLKDSNSELMPFLKQADLTIDTDSCRALFLKIESENNIVNITSLTSTRISYDTLILN